MEPADLQKESEVKIDSQGDGSMEPADLQKEIENLKDDIANLQKGVGELATTVAGVGKAGAGLAADKAQAEVQRRLEQLSASYAAVRDRADRAKERFEHTVEERPLTSVLVALGVGFVLGKLFSWR